MNHQLFLPNTHGFRILLGLNKPEGTDTTIKKILKKVSVLKSIHSEEKIMQSYYILQDLHLYKTTNIAVTVTPHTAYLLEKIAKKVQVDNVRHYNDALLLALMIYRYCCKASKKGKNSCVN